MNVVVHIYINAMDLFRAHDVVIFIVGIIIGGLLGSFCAFCFMVNRHTDILRQSPTRDVERAMMASPLLSKLPHVATTPSYPLQRKTSTGYSAPKGMPSFTKKYAQKAGNTDDNRDKDV